MKKCSELSKVNGFGNVYRTPCGIVSINVKGVTLHLSEEAFFDFYSMIEKAASVLINKKIGEIMREN